MYRRATNGYGSNISFMGKPIYYFLDDSDPAVNVDFKNPLSKSGYLKDMVLDGRMTTVLSYLTNWNLYSNGWVVTNRNDSVLFKYLTQISNTPRPRVLDFFR